MKIEMYYLMHKDIKVLQFSKECSTVLNEAHLPIALKCGDAISSPDVWDWLKDRGTPLNTERTRSSNLSSPIEFMNKWFSVSLTDCYWVKPAELLMNWEDINLFTNSFKELPPGVLSLKSTSKNPNYTLKGSMNKTWTFERTLVKSPTTDTSQEVYNEFIVSSILECFKNFPHVNYKLFHRTEGEPIVECVRYTSIYHEEVTAWDILGSLPNKNNASLYEAYTDYLINNLPNPEYQLTVFNTMLAIDFLVGNVDRHMENFGILRNPNTLEPIGQIPAYDFDRSLGLGIHESIWDINSYSSINSLFENELEQIENIDLSKVSLPSLEDILSKASSALESCTLLPPMKKDAILKFLSIRYNTLDKLIVENKSSLY